MTNRCLNGFNVRASLFRTSNVQCSANRFAILLALYFALAQHDRSQQHARIMDTAFGVHHISTDHICAFALMYPSKLPLRCSNSTSPANRGAILPIRL